MPATPYYIVMTMMIVVVVIDMREKEECVILREFFDAVETLYTREV
jgi:hypothetical protein